MKNRWKKITKKNKLFLIVGLIVLTVILICFFVALKNVLSTNLASHEYEIAVGGTYNISGNSGCIVINTKDTVELNLENANISCQTGPGINIEESDEVIITLEGENTITSTTTEELPGAIYSKADLVLLGQGNLNITANYDGIVSKDSLTIENGTYTIKANDDGIRGKDSVEILDGIFNITSSGDGIKSTNDEDSTKGYVEIRNGTFNITSNNDGIQAETNLTIKDGTFNIKTTGSVSTESDSSKGLKAGKLITINSGIYNIDTIDDSIHSNGNIEINSGTLTINTKDDGIHADDTLTINGGTISVESSYEGFEGSNIYIKDGKHNIKATDDGINAASSDSSAEKSTNMNGKDIFKNSTGLLEITGGITKVISDGDGLDSNGTILIAGGTTYVESTNQGPEEAIDHVGTMNITGGTLIAVAKNIANDDGTEISNIPYLNVSINNGTGKITIGDISYTPSISGYKYILIASTSLSTGENTLYYGSNSKNVTLSTGIISNISGNQGGPVGRR
jgi:hypothetical protein